MKLFSKIGGFIAAALTVVTLTATPASAQWLNSASGWAQFSGGNSTVIGAGLSSTNANSVGNTQVTTQATPPIVVAGADLQQQTGGFGLDSSLVSGQLFQTGVANAAANSEFAGSSTNGEGNMLGIANGTNSQVAGSMTAQSNQDALAIDTPLGGGNAAYAEQSISVGIAAQANSAGSGSQSAATSANGYSSSASVAGGS